MNVYEAGFLNLLESKVMQLSRIFLIEIDNEFKKNAGTFESVIRGK